MAPRALILDITRLAARLDGRPMTGIDRVEAAYLREALRRTAPLLLIWRQAPFTMVLGAGAGAALRAVIDGQAAAAGLPQRLRSHALGRAMGPGLARLIRRHAPTGGDYLNVGHMNLRPRGLAQMRRAGLRVQVMIHDTIPLDFPQFQPPGSPARFRRRLLAALRGADRIIANSAATAADVSRWAARLGLACPPVLTAPLGIDLAAPAALPAGLAADRPWFVTTGTIEPRKNHALLLDSWGLLAARLPAARVPLLLILGRRGWAGAALMARLDALPPDGPVRAWPGLDDGQVAALTAGARAALIPSWAEGFGLPAFEAAARGTPILAAPLPALAPLAGPGLTTLPPDDPAAWAEAVARATLAPAPRPAPLDFPGWTDHVDLVLSGLPALG